MITWTKVLKLLEWKPQPNDYKELQIDSVRNNATKTINPW